MDIKPIDILNAKFSRRFKGYNPEEVDNFLKAAAAAFEEALVENVRLTEELARANEEIARFKSTQETLNNALILAEKTAEEIKNAAQKEAELIISEAKQNLEREMVEARQELEKLYAERDRFRIEFRALLRSFLDVSEECIGGGASDGDTSNQEAGQS